MDSALANDESHWREMADREQVEREVDRKQFGVASHHLRNLPDSTVNQLVRLVADARMQGREDAARGRR